MVGAVIEPQFEPLLPEDGVRAGIHSLPGQSVAQLDDQFDRGPRQQARVRCDITRAWPGRGRRRS
jgi:hypothetical protein